MSVTEQSVAQICLAAKQAARELAVLPTATRDAALLAIADAIEARSDEILAANQIDLDNGREAGLDAALMDRLLLNEARLAGIASDVRSVVALDDPANEVFEERELYNGLRLRRIAVPLGLIAVFYEARPNVTIDAAALCIKSGNAIVLRGSSAAANSNAILAGIARDAATAAGLPEATISLVAGGGHDELAELATQDGVVDLIIPRGGEALKAALKGVATVPVIYAAAGNCHVYVDETADLANAVDITINAKTQRPGVCNAAETLLVHSAIADAFIPQAATALIAAGVELHGDDRTRAAAGPSAEAIKPASEEDWLTEYHSLTLAVKVVDSVDEAIDHINKYGTGHSEAILTNSDEAAAKFTGLVDSAAVYVNASTRFTDGAEFGLGAEIGISTQKLHARGPIGLRELCSYKYIIEGDGQSRG
ncbi:MAG: glutamate-5-semialdehyde dehydrogenase [Thermoleophilaceae bacterium]|nr:glutamate-5-semialdehyde dehydrogenase [Thermoleophilaceae bacterium]